MTHTGKCLCGAVTFEGKGKPSAIHACHCRDCQRWTGGPFLGVDFEGGIDFEGEVSWFQSSDWAERGFCPKCGATLFYRLRDGSYINTAIGFLDDPDAIAPVAREIFIDRKPAGYALAGEQQRMTGDEFFAWLKEMRS